MTPNHRFKHHHRHTPKHGTQHATKSQCNQKNKKYIGTLSSSQTTTAHPNTPQNTVAHSKRRRLTLTKHSQQRKHAPHHRTYFVMSASGSFPNRHLTNQLFTESVWRGVVGLADSHKVTHTPTTTQIASSDSIFTTSYQGSFGLRLHVPRRTVRASRVPPAMRIQLLAASRPRALGRG